VLQQPGSCGPDIVPDLKIHGAIEDFKPDCGIHSLGAAIEFKIVKDDLHKPRSA